MLLRPFEMVAVRKGELYEATVRRVNRFYSETDETDETDETHDSLILFGCVGTDVVTSKFQNETLRRLGRSARSVPG